MWNIKFGIAVSCTPENADSTFRMLKKIGFDAVSPDWDGNLKENVKIARDNGLTVHYLHAPFNVAAKMWSTDRAEREKAADGVMRSLTDCAANGIPILVVHAWIGFDYEFTLLDKSFEAYDKLVDTAKSLGVTVAFENTEGGEFLTCLMERYKDRENVGFCWDSGHEMCYNYSKDLLHDYGDRLVMTHLNDNLGVSRFDGTTFWTDDLHLLPYDGVANWTEVKTRLRGSRKQEFLNFELCRYSKPDRHENDKYAKMSDLEYYTEVYVRACRLGYGLYE